MKKATLFALAFLINQNAISQKSFSNRSRIGISIPVIWNSSEATYYALGSPKHPKGKAISYGLNINYCFPLYKDFYGKLGVGYYKQKFGISRPFNYTPPDGTKPVVYTTHYDYDNFQFLIGIGYRKEFVKDWFFNGEILYNIFNSYRQKYFQNYFPNNTEINKKSLSIGNAINFEGGIEKNVSNKISLGANLIIPVYTHWNSDKIFTNSYYSTDELVIARNKYSIGVSVSFYYHF